MDGRDNTIMGCLVVEAYAPDAMAIKTSVRNAMQAQASIRSKQLKVNCGLICDVTEIISYTEIEYLTFNGTQIYDVGYKGNNQTTLEIKFKRTNVTSPTYLFGCDGNTSSRLTAYLNSNGYWRYGSYGRIFGTRNTNIHTAEVTPNGINFNSDVYEYSANNFETPHPLSIGGYTTSSGERVSGYRGYIYYFRMYIDGVLVCDWIPVRRDDGVECFFDRVKNNFVTPIDNSQQTLSLRSNVDEEDYVE